MTARLSTQVITADAGGVADLIVTVRNEGTVVDQLRMEVLGDARSWAEVAQAAVGLFPGEEAAVAIRLSPPRTPGFLLQEVPFAVKVTSQADPTASVVEEGAVQIGAFRDIATELRPRTVAGRRGADFELVLENRGNSPATLTLHADEPEALLEFRVAETVEIGPGETLVQPLRVVTDKRRWTGKDEARPFSVQTQPDEGEPTVVSGTFVQRPMLSRRAWIALAALVALLLLWFAVLRPVVRSTAIRQAEVAVAKSKDQPPGPTPGPEGPAGPAGPEGIAGAVGPLGPAGPVGPKGLDGAAGPAGAAGAAGEKGADGAAGPAGTQGTPGAAGADGANGLDGAAGTNGQAGRDGVNGFNGLQGPVGAQGPQGAPGLDGASMAFYDHRPLGPSSVVPSPGAEFTTIITQHLDPGLYVLTAKTMLSTANSSLSDCILTSDTGSGEVTVDGSSEVLGGGAPTSSTHNLLHLLESEQAPATIRLRCRAGTVWSAHNSRIAAIQLQDALIRNATPPDSPVGGPGCGGGGSGGQVVPGVEPVPCQ